MKTKLLILSLLAAAVISVALAELNGSRATKEFMRDKLEPSQRVLEGRSTEDGFRHLHFITPENS